MNDILIINLNDNDSISLESEFIYFDKRINNNIKKTTIVCKLDESKINKNKIDNILKLSFGNVKNILINKDIIEENINLDFKILNSYYTNLNPINNRREENIKYLVLVLEFSNIKEDQDD